MRQTKIIAAIGPSSAGVDDANFLPVYRLGSTSAFPATADKPTS
jgi:hypothetical protein